MAYNLNCRLVLFNREEDAKAAALRHTTPATARLRILSLAARIWRHAERVGVGYRLEIGDLAVTREHPLA